MRVGGGGRRGEGTELVSGLWAMCSYYSSWVLMPPVLALSLKPAGGVYSTFFF